MDLELHLDPELGPLYILAGNMVKRGELFEHPRTRALSFAGGPIATPPSGGEGVQKSGADESIAIRVLQDVSFAMAEGERHNLRKGELVGLPTPYAKALLAKRLAEATAPISAERESETQLTDVPTRDNTPLSTVPVPEVVSPQAMPVEASPAESLLLVGPNLASAAEVPFVIPERLRDPRFRFVLVKKKDKIPIETGWQKDANHTYDDPKLTTHLARGGNYGILCGNGLVVIDADTSEVREAVLTHYPPPSL